MTTDKASTKCERKSRGAPSHSEPGWFVGWWYHAPLSLPSLLVGEKMRGEEEEKEFLLPLPLSVIALHVEVVPSLPASPPPPVPPGMGPPPLPPRSEWSLPPVKIAAWSE